MRLREPDVQDTALISREQQWEWLEELDDANFFSMSVDSGLHLDALIVPNLNLVVSTTRRYQAQVVSVITRDDILCVTVRHSAQHFVL